MATKSFNEKVVIKDPKVIAEIEKDLESSDIFNYAHKSEFHCSSNKTINDSKKWNI